MKNRILTGDRPTGKLHLGHYVGSLKNRLKYQEEGSDVFIIIADYHTLTTKHSSADIEKTQAYTKDLVLDYLSVGLDPKKVTIYQQSLIPEVAELNLIFEMLVSVNRLGRIPTLKEKIKESGKESLGEVSFGLLGYPVLQAADILMVKANLVPVGKDQKSHVELTREIARAFNRSYRSVFPEPKAILGDDFLPGIDGREKMGKSMGNAIYLSDDSVTVATKVMGMFTDVNRVHASDPGKVEGNPVFIYHRVFNDDKNEVADLEDRYQKGTVGDVEVKKKLALAINRFLDPIREERQKYFQQDGYVQEIIREGSRQARKEASRTLKEVREAMRLPQLVA